MARLAAMTGRDLGSRGTLPMLACLAWLTACAPPCPPARPPSPDPAPAAPPSAPAPAASFDIDPAALRRNGASDELIAKLASSPFRYFRLLADAYERRTCEAFRDDSGAMPVVAVHGDAHLEQFVVTSTAYGIEDFDRAGFGPMVVDLVRYAASLHIACEVASFDCDPEAAVARYLDEVQATLTTAPAPSEPSVVAALRSKAPAERTAWLAWAEGRMGALDGPTDAALRRHWPEFIATMSAVRPDVPPASFEIVRAGKLSMGIGSALERKLLIRVAGPSATSMDDMLIEAREGMPPDPGGCVWRPSNGESLILMFSAVLGRRMPNIHGFVQLLDGSRRFWVQDWDEGYTELSVQDIDSQAVLEELAVDAARQLSGHFWTKFPPALLAYQLHAQRETFEAARPRIAPLARDYAAETIAAWQCFQWRTTADRGGSPGRSPRCSPGSWKTPH